MILVFVIFGPMIWPFGMYATPTPMSGSGSLHALFHGDVPLHVIVSMLYGFWTWWMSLLFPLTWLMTWIPTVLAALACERLLYLICVRYRVRFNARITLIGFCGVAFSVVSAAIFQVLSMITVLPQGLAQSATLNPWTPTVAITGAVLGVIVGSWPRLTPSTPAVASC